MSERKKFPEHIAIIMDGNGRWAKEKKLPRTAGHKAGMERVKEIIETAANLGVRCITLFAFSENWTRPKNEITLLMRSLVFYLGRQIGEMIRKNIKFVSIGRDYPLPGYVLNKIKEAREKTKDNTGMVVVLALNYGSRQEIVDGVKKFCLAVVGGEAKVEDLDENEFSGYLYTAGLPDPDLLIRTSGELRLSNFLLWQLSYAELYFPNKYWPEFRAKDLEKAIKVYCRRERRFGGINAGKKDY